MSNMAFHAHHRINELLQYGDNKLRSLFSHQKITATEIRFELSNELDHGRLFHVIGHCLHKNPDGSCAGHILPSDLDRDDEGWFCHPDLPNLEEGEQDALSNWIYEQGLSIKVVFMTEEVTETHPAYIEYFENGGNAEQWQPELPAEPGWFMLCLFDSEEGPVCWWAKHKEDFKVITIPGAVNA